MSMQTIQSVPETGFIGDAEFRRLLGGKSHATLWRWTREGMVPPAVKIGPNSNGRRCEDVREFLADPEAWRAQHSKKATP